MLQFEPWSSAVDATFWFELSRKKLNELRLDDSILPVKGYYLPGFLIKKGMPSPSRLFLTSFHSEPLYPKHHIVCSGTLKNVNILNEFKSIDKVGYLKEQGKLIWDAIESGRAIQSPEILSHFSLLTYSDLKSNKFYYWFAFPTLILPEPASLIQSTPLTVALSQCQITSLCQSLKEQAKYCPFFAIRVVHDLVTLIPLSDYNPQDSTHFPALIDSSGLDSNLGWHSRNFLCLLKRSFGLNRVQLYCLREDVMAGPSEKSMASSALLELALPGTLTGKMPEITGWEPNASGKMGPRITDLSSMMDPKKLAENAVDLNLKLMKWRILPDLSLEKINPLKCLLFGAGTLGTNVARSLMGWGIRHVTFVDYGRVSYSNPARQSLYTFEDCIGEGKSKATVAAEALKTIFPSMVSSGHVLTVPMPGHHVDSVENTEKTIQALESLVDEHDVLFLLTDSREARWLPTLLGAAKGKIVINAALGFDTFLVMRHGMRTNDPRNPDLGCYFCNDVVAPTNSMADRTLDQMCTVSRPGLSAIASAMAVELLVSITTHPNGPYAPAHVTLNPSQTVPSDSSILGLVPHQIRGYLSHFAQSLIIGQSYNQCVACSPVILDAYNQEGAQFILKALAQPDYLEELTGLKKLQEEALDLDFDDDF